MRIVLDTNVIVSGHLSPRGTPAEILKRVSADELTLCYDARIFTEYEQVLRRPQFDIPGDSIDSFLDQLGRYGEMTIGTFLDTPLPDPDDRPFLEVALAAKVPLVTGNLRDFPVSHRMGVLVISPADFYKSLCEK